MGKTTSITLLLFLILSFATTTFSAIYCGDHGGDSCSNLEHQEVGDAVYRDIIAYEETKLLDQYQHAAIFYGYKDSKLQVLQASGNWIFGHSVHYGDFIDGEAGFINNSNGKTYYGAYNISNLSSSNRASIRSYAVQMEADSDIDYTFFNAIDKDSFISFPLDVNEIDNTRCDGVVEFTYEKTGKYVWGYNSSYWNITSSDTNLDKHNDMPDSSVEPYTELSPRAQHGGYSNTNTYLVASTPKSPTTSASVTSGLQGSNGWYKSDVQVDIQANDESGIYYIKYKIGSEGSYYDYSAPITITSSETLSFYAKDNAGNYPRYNDYVTINIDKNSPSVSISLPCGSSCSATSSSTTISGSVSDSGGSNLDKVYVYNQTNGSSGWDYSVLSGTFSVLGISLNSGSNTIQATAYDVAGNVSNVDTIYVTYTSLSPPFTPSTPSATDGSYTDKVRISWSNVSGATTYKIYRCTSSLTSSCSYLTSDSLSPYDDTGGTAGTTYYYRIKASNSVGDSGYSNYNTGYKAVNVSPPFTPSTPSATDGSYTDKVRISWSNVSGATTYKIYRCTSSLTSSCSYLTSDSLSPYDDTGGTAGTTYYYRIKASNSVGDSGYSNYNTGYKASIDASYYDNSQDPIDPTYEVNSIHRFTLAYTNTGTDDWKNTGDLVNPQYIELRSVNINGAIVDSAIYPADDTWIDRQRVVSFNHLDATNVAPGETGWFFFNTKMPSTPGDYSIYFQPYHATGGLIGLKRYFNINVIASPSPPSTPSTPSATDGSYTDRVRVSWSNVSGATTYKMYRCTTSSTSSCSYLGSDSSSPYDDTGGTAVTIYYYRIKASNSAGDSGYSNYNTGYKAVTVVDTTLPTISITSPTSNSTYSTSSNDISIGGTASDNVGVTSVTWSNNRGGSGSCNGTTSWNSSGITLYDGQNIITITAQDTAGNIRADSLTVIYNSPDTGTIDNFDDGVIDPSKWMTGGSSVYERNGLLDFRVEVTDGGGWANSSWIDFDPTEPIVIERDVLLHYGNNRFIGRLHVEIEGAPEVTFGVNYANMDYFSSTWVSKYGIYLFKDNSTGHRDTSIINHSDSINGIWDQWFHEKLIYNPETGLLKYYINNELKITYNVGLIPNLPSYKVRVFTSPWGWYTGHYQYMDNFSLILSNPNSTDSNFPWPLFLAAINAAKNDTHSCNYNQVDLCVTKADCLHFNGYWYDYVSICSGFTTFDHLLVGSWKDSWDETYITYYPDGTFYGEEFGDPYRGVWVPISVDTALNWGTTYPSGPFLLTLLNDVTYIYPKFPSLGEYHRTDIYNPTTVPSAGQIWMDRNLGASRVAKSATDSEAYGDLYQWGRGRDGHEKRTSPKTLTNSNTDTPGHGSFILDSSPPYDWRTPQNDSLWQGVSGTNNPCPSGFRLPTSTEFYTELNSWSSNNSAGAFASPLKLVVAGARDNGGHLTVPDNYGNYWSSSVRDGSSGVSILSLGNIQAYVHTHHRAYGFSVRCIMD